MISVAEAQQRIEEAVRLGPAEDCPWTQAHGRVLRASIRADRPSPPFDRIMMDGFALASGAWADGQRSFEIQQSVGAGHEAPPLRSPDGALEVMTGGTLPSGCDLVVPVEWCTTEGNHLRISPPESAILEAGLYIHARGSDGDAGRIVLEEGTRLGPAALAVAVTEGATTLRVNRKPRIYLLTTGDEVVLPEATPQPWQIRGSHAAALSALCAQWGPMEWTHAHVGDEEEALRAAIANALDTCDLLITVGGVSRGKWDLVPGVLGSLGVEEKLHRVAQRPGKPIWFGVRDQQLVFGLPGNPVSALCSARRYLWPALDQWCGVRPVAPPLAILGDAIERLPHAVRFVPVHADGAKVLPILPRNSGALHALTRSTGFVECPPGSEPITAGTELPYYPWTR